jgi:hypothetical protein
VFGVALLNGEGYDVSVRDGKVIIEGDRAAIKGFRYCHITLSPLDGRTLMEQAVVSPFAGWESFYVIIGSAARS